MTMMLLWFCLLLFPVVTKVKGKRPCTSQPQVSCTEQDEECSELMKEYKLLMQCRIPFETNLLNTTQSALIVQWSYNFNDQDTIDGFLFVYGTKCRVIRLENIRIWGKALNKEVNFSIIVYNSKPRRLVPIMLRSQQPDKWNAVIHYDRNQPYGSMKANIETMTYVSRYTVEVMVGSCASEAIRTLTIFKSVFYLHNLTSGSYCFRIRPHDPHPLDPLQCACYEGTKLCRTCQRICPATVAWFNFSKETTTQFYEEQTYSLNQQNEVTDSTQKPSTTSHVAVIIGGVLGGVAFLVLLVTIFIIRHRSIRQILLRKFTGLHRRNVVFVVTDDDIIFVALLDSLIECLENYCLCNVNTLKTFDQSKNLDSTSLQLLATSDRIIIVNTEKFSSEYESWVSQVLVDDESRKKNVSMFCYLKRLANEQVSKIVMIEFTSYSKYANNITSFLGKTACFQLLRQFDEFVCCLHSISKRQASLIYSQPYKSIRESKEFKLLETSISSEKLNSSKKTNSTMSRQSLDVNYSERGFSISDRSYDRICGSDCDISMQDPGCDFSTTDVGPLTLQSSEEICDTNSEDILRITTNLKEMDCGECITIASESV